MCTSYIFCVVALEAVMVKYFVIGASLDKEKDAQKIENAKNTDLVH